MSAGSNVAITSSNCTSILYRSLWFPKEELITNDDIKLAPNPAYSREEIRISLPDEFDTNIAVQVFDYNGRAVYSKSFKRLTNIISFNPSLRVGQYIVIILDSQNQKLTKHLLVR